MKNPIPTSRLFATPATEQALLEQIQRLPGVERALAFQIAMLTLNLCHNLVDREMQKQLDNQLV